MKRERNVYLNMKTLTEARRIFFDRFALSEMLAAERLSSADAVDRVLAEPVYARLSAPSYHAAAMDGVAVAAERTYGARLAKPRELAVGKEVFFVNTGDRLPEGTDAVIMIENVQVLEGDRIRIESAAYPWQHVRKVGEDIVATEMLFARNHQLTPYDVGALLLGGVFSVLVRCRPRVLVVPTGGEVVDWQNLDPSALAPGQIIEANGTVLGKLVESCGGLYERHAPMPDEPDRIAELMQQALQGEFDMVLVIGGSSAGAHDYTRAAIAAVGEVLCHGVTIMPGKPTVLGAVEQKPVVGIPGYPVSAIVAFEQFAGPALLAMQGQREQPRPRLKAHLSRKVASKLGLEEFVRVALARVGERVVAVPLPRGAGAITTITRADGVLRIGTELEGLAAEEAVEAELLRPPQAVEGQLVIVGSHDNCLDVLADLLRAGPSGVRLASSHVGSLGGLLALRRHGCHLAGCHLLDPSDGSYNVSYLRQHLAGVPVKLVHLVMRQQGLIVPAGNPKRVEGMADLGRDDLRFINRQAGSGTRVLLDYHLAEAGIDPGAIRGYSAEEYTHMAVAVAVQSGAADLGLGIRAAAQALGLDFVPVATEQYDLVIAAEHFGTEGIEALLEVIRGDEFLARVNALGGYDTSRTGELVWQS